MKKILPKVTRETGLLGIIGLILIVVSILLPFFTSLYMLGVAIFGLIIGVVLYFIDYLIQRRKRKKRYQYYQLHRIKIQMCPECGRVIPLESNACYYCGFNFNF